MKKILLLLLSAFIIIACERDPQFLNNANHIPLIIKVIIDGESSHEYTYTSANFIREDKSRFFYTRHNYNSDGLLESSEYYMDPRIISSSSYVLEEAMKRKDWVNSGNTPRALLKTYEYDRNGQMNRIIFIRQSSNNSEYTSYLWENGRISRQAMYWQNELSGYINFKYDENGNLIREDKYSVREGENPELMTTTEYEFDQMHNPYLSFSSLMLPGKYTNTNNITRETYTIHFEVDKYTQKVQTHANSYKYNKDGYPVEVNGEAVYVYR
ncbi:MAG: hypothetical protein MUD02_05005 [Bacteroidales bacterium]|jgi:hypothetical protein|nr:hypothetical protein [Bacteroidales bacterium]MCU0408290.1 hypothetical protein [Bacteroidales bacterium]